MTTAKIMSNTLTQSCELVTKIAEGEHDDFWFSHGDIIVSELRVLLRRNQWYRKKARPEFTPYECWRDLERRIEQLAEEYANEFTEIDSQ